MEPTIDLTKLTPEQRRELAKEALELEKQEQKNEEQNRQAYKNLVDEKVNDLFPILVDSSEQLMHSKKHVYEEFDSALKMKSDLYNVKDDQRSHTFSNHAGDKRITLGYYMADNYDDTVNEGISKVQAYISSLATEKVSQSLVDAVMKLMSKDGKGNLKASRVLQLRKMATESENLEFIDGVNIIESAYKPIRTKTFVKAEYKDELGAWKPVPLGMTEA